MDKQKKDAWQQALHSVRDAHKDRIESWFLRLDDIITKAKDGQKVDKNEIEALKLGFRFFDALKEKEPPKGMKLSRPTKPKLKPSHKKGLDEILGQERIN